MEHVLFDQSGHVATITLNRPEKLNAVTPEMTDAIRELVQHCSADRDVRVVVLTGAGEKAFCAGSDIRELDQYPSAWEFRRRPDYCDAVRHLTKPAIAMINGYALGGGLELAMSCDIRTIATSARVGAPEIKLGWIGGGGMSAFLAHSVGPSNAAVMLMTGDPVSAEDAHRWGLASILAEPGELAERTYELAARIAASAPIAAQTAKMNLRAAYTMPLEAAIAYERDLQTICMGTQDADEGRAAFKEKRAPRWQAR